MIRFNGVKYSKTTDIFYRFHKGELYRFGIFKDSFNTSILHKWIPSDFIDMEGRSKTWTNATQEQIDRYYLLDSIGDRYDR